ncbi:polyamine transporter 3 [Eremomyces bilateralis CBS 781.70]|uniref:Polyamine transporter 3 n=1 Tax=Eremomyces bilateralis CBS 781.70 TaxID=1392243 RepID=A0A6G1GGP8_9PEZI|nr:polyamine transporter 3 [Eremomyces bilateralis CBS 781.70]KAF1817275.1 polyamine transporter 3 [Eremomyces bilateralis CBS 781.70]
MEAPNPESSKDSKPHSPTSIPHWRLIRDQSVLTPDVIDHEWPGSGTESDPYIVSWLDADARNPMTWKTATKWTYAMGMAGATLTVAFCSSAYSGGIRQIIAEFQCSQIVATLGLSLFVMGFAIGPLFWAPLSEMYGRQVLFAGTFAAYTAFNAAAAGSQNIWTLIILRFWAGAFGSSPLTNAGGVIADMFPANERGLAMAIFSAAPFMGPVLGPIAGGFLGHAAGWRWVEGLLAAVSGTLWIVGMVLVPETYTPVLLRKRAEALSKLTGKVYVSKLQKDTGKTSVKELYITALSRPWILLIREPIVFILSTYMAIIYGTLYMLFGAYPIVYQQGRGWSEGIGGLPFLGVAIGMLFAVAYVIFIGDPHYMKAVQKNGGFAPPEARIPMLIVGGVVLPIGLFWFAWTNDPAIPWPASVAAGIPFGFGMVLIFLGTMNYLIDAYTIFAASVLAASSVLRSCFGAAFPLFTSYMYRSLGIHWASSIPAFLALACVPFPFLFYKYGAGIRKRCKYSAESDAFMSRLRGDETPPEEGEFETEEERDVERAETPARVASKERDMEKMEEEAPVQGAEEGEVQERQPRVESIRTGTRGEGLGEYDESPFDIDRVNTRESFKKRSSADLGRK